MKTETFTVRLPPEHVERIKAAAAREGVPPATLASRWLLERLNHPPTKELLARALVVILAGLSDIDKQTAVELVREHFLETEENLP